MEEQRQATIERIVELTRQFYRHSHQRRLDSGHDWTEVDLTMPQLKVLFTVVSLEGATMSQLAREVGMTLSTATGVADRLIAQGYVRRESDPEDRRKVWLRPTEAAVVLVDRFTQVGDSLLRLIASRLSLEELVVVARATELLHRAMLELTSETEGVSR